MESNVEGTGKAINFPEAVHGTISNALSTGIETGFNKIEKPFDQAIMKIFVVMAGLLFVIWGLPLFFGGFAQTDGFGLLLVGAFFGIIAMLALQKM